MVKIGVLGLGHVGSSVLELLQRNKETLRQRAGTELAVKRVLVRDPSKPRVHLADGMLTVCPEDVLGDQEISVIVELIGGKEPALSYIKEALSRGKNVVTANKEVISQHGGELLEMAREAGVSLLFEGSVCGGIPIVRPLRECLVANEISTLVGILNGTTNYILTSMQERELELEEALLEARSLGYAESDPTDDLCGADAARKLSILASIAFNGMITPRQIKTEGIDNVMLADIRYARELGYRVKLIAYGIRRGHRVEVSVGPQLLKMDHPLAPVGDVYNAVVVEGDAVGRVMFYGRGAGGMPTASAVIGDIVDAARSGGSKAFCTYFNDIEVLAPREIASRFYLRLSAVDRPGVLSRISGALGRHGISLSMVLQKNTQDGIAEVVLVTHLVKSGSIDDALQEIRTYEEVPAVSSIIRVWG